MKKTEAPHSARVLDLREILTRETDEAHPLTCARLTEKLRARGYRTSPSTTSRDIQALRKSGFEVISLRGGRQSGYYSIPQPFTLTQIRTLLDAAQAFTYIPPDKTKILTEQLYTLVSDAQAEDLKKSTVLFNTRKHSNNTVFYTIDACDTALRNRTCLSFRYFHLGPGLGRHYHNDGLPYTVEPFALICFEDNYYLLALRADMDDEAQALHTYRVDRMDKTQALPVPASPRVEKYRDTAAEYTKKVFKMYSGQDETVTLRFSAELCNPVYDKFGEQITIIPLPGGDAELTETVQISSTFYGWVAQFGDKMRIEAPESTRKKYVDWLLSAIEHNR